MDHKVELKIKIQATREEISYRYIQNKIILCNKFNKFDYRIKINFNFKKYFLPKLRISRLGTPNIDDSRISKSALIN